MRVVHFTVGATDPMIGFGALGTRVVPLAAGRREDDVTVSCYHIAAGGRLGETPFVHDCALLVVMGRLTMTGGEFPLRLEVLAGMGVVLSAGEPFAVESEAGGIVIAVEAPTLLSTERGISTPDRIAGQRWPGERLRRRSLREVVRSLVDWVGRDSD
jgi:hypothetical protein